MYAEVRSVERLSPSLARVTLGGGTLADLRQTDATDARLNVRFVPEGSPVTVPFDTASVAGLPIDQQPRPRKFLIRRWDPVRRELVIDMVLHGDVGYAGRWVRRARPGDRLQFEGPGESYRPSPDVDWHLLVGDESAFGAIGASLDALGPSDRGRVIAVVDGPDDEIVLSETAAEVDVVWCHRRESADPEHLLLRAVETAQFPDDRFDVFVHGEAAEVRAVRRHLVAERGVDPDSASISPCWRRRHTDEEWRQVKRQWLTDQSADTAIGAT